MPHIISGKETSCSEALRTVRWDDAFDFNYKYDKHCFMKSGLSFVRLWASVLLPLVINLRSWTGYDKLGTFLKGW